MTKSLRQERDCLGIFLGTLGRKGLCQLSIQVHKTKLCQSKFLTKITKTPANLLLAHQSDRKVRMKRSWFLGFFLSKLGKVSYDELLSIAKREHNSTALYFEQIKGHI